MPDPAVSRVVCGNDPGPGARGPAVVMDGGGLVYGGI